MKKFMALYMMSVEEMDEMMKNSTPEEQQKGMNDWNKWQEEHAADFAEAGKPLGKNKRVTADGATDARNEVAGYSIVQAASQDAAAEIFSDSPHLKMPGAYVEIMELVDM
jgi:hypothetical protein